MDEQTLDPLPPRHLDQRHEVPQVAVDAARRNQPDQVQRLSALAALEHCVDKRTILEEIAVHDALVDTSQILVDNPPRPQVHMPHLRVSHLAGRQSDRFAGRDE